MNLVIIIYLTKVSKMAKAEPACKVTELKVFLDDAVLERAASFFEGLGRLEGNPPRWAIRQLAAELLQVCAETAEPS